MRGLTPKTWTWLPPPDGNMPIKTWGVLVGGAPFQLDHRHIIGTDGSGGLFSSDPRLRRCGCGCIVLDRELMAPIGGAAFPLAGPIQTVPRSELSALIFVASRTRGAAPAFIDARYVVGGLARGCGARHRKNQDLWAKYWEITGARGGDLKAFHIRSHRPDITLGAGHDPAAFLVNALADKLADDAAATAKPSSRDVAAIRGIDERARRIQARIIAIAEAVRDTASPRRLREQPATQTRHTRAAMRRETLHRRALAAGHVLVRRNKAFVCTRCGPTKPPKPSSAFGPVCRPVGADVPPGIHPSHSPHLRCTHGLWWCTRCGAWTTGAAAMRAKFTGPCLQAGRGGRQVIASLVRGQLPGSVRLWPDGTLPGPRPTSKARAKGRPTSPSR